MSASYICKQCNKPTLHYEFHDSYFCISCNTWNESLCSYGDCHYCINRPSNPLNSEINNYILEVIKHTEYDVILHMLEYILEELNCDSESRSNYEEYLRWKNKLNNKQ